MNKPNLILESKKAVPIDTNEYIELNVGEKGLGAHIKTDYDLTGIGIRFAAQGADNTIINGGTISNRQDNLGEFDFIWPEMLTDVSSGFGHPFMGQFTLTSNDGVIVDVLSPFLIIVKPTIGIQESYKGTIDTIDGMVKQALDSLNALLELVKQGKNSADSKLDSLGQYFNTEAKALMQDTTDKIDAAQKQISSLKDELDQEVVDAKNSLNQVIDKIKADGKVATDKVAEDGETAVNKVTHDGEATVNNLIETGNSTVKQIKDNGEAAVSGINDSGSSAIASISENGEKAIQKVATDSKNKIDEIDEQASSQRTSLQSDYNVFKESLNNNFNSLKSDWIDQLGALEKQIAALQDRAGTINSDLNNSKNTVGDLQKDIKDTQIKIDNIKNELADVDFKEIADTAKVAKETADNAKALANTANITAINAGKVKTVSLNGGAKIDPDATGNIDLSVPKNESSSVKYYKLELLKTEADFNLQFQNGTIKLITDEHGTPHLSGEITFNYNLGKSLSEWDSAAGTTITRLAAEFLLVNIHDEKDYFITPEQMSNTIQTISIVRQMDKVNYYYSCNMLNTEEDEKGGRGYIIFSPEYGSKWANYLSSIRIDY